MRNVDEITSLSNRTHFWFTSTPFLAILSISIGFKPYNFNRTQTFFQINTLKPTSNLKNYKVGLLWNTLKLQKETEKGRPKNKKEVDSCQLYQTRKNRQAYKDKYTIKKATQRVGVYTSIVGCINGCTNTQSRKQRSVWMSTHPFLAVQIHNQESNTGCGCLHIHFWLYKEFLNIHNTI